MQDIQLLIQWFLKKRRALPWRINPTPYAVWVSEVMLQQTQVIVVIPYYLKWMEKFPTIAALAAAPLEDIIKLWEGLGYYSRARNLHEGAKFIVNHFEGELPSDAASLSLIKGIGEYTKGAILSFAFHQRFPAVDGNTIRVLSRYFMIEDDISKAKTQQVLRKIAAEILPEDYPWIAVEALIELGATVCQRKANCQICPLINSCKSYLNSTTDKIPYKSSKIKVQNLYRAVAILECEGAFLVRCVSPNEIMSGLHEFPYFEAPQQRIEVSDLLSQVEERFQIKAAFLSSMPETTHSFTRYNVRLFPFHLKCDERKWSSGFKWMSLTELKKVAFPSGHRRIYHNFNLTENDRVGGSD
jgi:A/G-specific adenine glycosylase